MKRIKKKESTIVTEILDIAVMDHKKFKELLEAFIETENSINAVFYKGLNGKIKEIIIKNPNNKNIQELLTLTQNVNQKHKFDHQARVIYAIEAIKKFKPRFGLDLRNEFEVIDGNFAWKKDIKEML